MTANTAVRSTPTTRVVGRVRRCLTGAHTPAGPRLNAAPDPNLAPDAAHTNDLASAALRFHFRS